MEALLRLRAWLFKSLSRPSTNHVEPFQPLPDDATVLRVLKKKEPFFSPPDYREPTRDAFRPTTADVEEGKRRGRSPGVSVFDQSRCSPQQAVTIRTHFATLASRPLGEVGVYSIAVSVVRQIGRAYNPDVDVVTDPLVKEDGAPLDIPGADGHSLIEGLWEPSKSKRRGPDYKALLDKLATSAVPPE